VKLLRSSPGTVSGFNRALWVSTMGLSTFYIAAMATLSPNVLLIE